MPEHLARNQAKINRLKPFFQASNLQVVMYCAEGSSYQRNSMFISLLDDDCWRDFFSRYWITCWFIISSFASVNVNDPLNLWPWNALKWKQSGIHAWSRTLHSVVCWIRRIPVHFIFSHQGMLTRVMYRCSINCHQKATTAPPLDNWIPLRMQCRLASFLSLLLWLKLPHLRPIHFDKFPCNLKNLIWNRSINGQWDPRPRGLTSSVHESA